MVHLDFQDGKVPLCLAAAEGHYDIISYLLKKDHDTTDLMDDKHVCFLLEVTPLRENLFF